MSTTNKDPILDLFKRQTISFIRWVASNEEAAAGAYSEDIAAVRKLTTFKDVQQVLADYDGSFMRLVKAGYL